LSIPWTMERMDVPNPPEKGETGAMETNRRNTAILFIVAGSYFLLGKLIGYVSVSALLLIWLGLYRVKTDRDAKGYFVLVAGAVLLFGNYFTLFLAIVLISLGWFLIKSQKVHRDNRHVRKHAVVDSIRLDSGAWTPVNTSRWSLFSEVRMDLSLAMQEEEEVTFMLQGFVGDIDVILPPDYGLRLESNMLVGRVAIGGEKDGGFLNRRFWQSPNYEHCPHKMKLIVGCIVGDIEIRTV